MPPTPSNPQAPTGLHLAALTHPSYANEHAGTEHYQRLEFLGDALIKGYVAEVLYYAFPDEHEGQLSDRMHQIVSRVGLAKAARTLGLDARDGLGRYVRLGGSERIANVDGLSDKILEELFEAWVGATFLVDGPGAARALVQEAARQNGLSPLTSTNYKDILQRYVQRAVGELPTYSAARVPGTPDHLARWEASVALPDGEGAPWAPGLRELAEERSKLAAEQAAARALLLRLGVDPDTAPAERPPAALPPVSLPTPAAKPARSQLKELADGRAELPPVYADDEEGPPHRRVFTATCTFRGQVGRGSAATKKAAQEAAAADVLQRLTIGSGGGAA